MELNEFSLESKVIPISKTAGSCSFESCPHWKNARKNGNFFLIVGEIDKARNLVLCYHGQNSNRSAYAPSDLLPYSDNERDFQKSIWELENKKQ